MLRPFLINPMSLDPLSHTTTPIFYRVVNRLYLLSVSDGIGSETYKHLRLALYPGTDIFLLCFSVMDSSTLENIKAVWLPEIRGPCPKARFLLVGLQADLRNKSSNSGDSPVPKEKAISTAAELGAIKYIECSSEPDHGIEEVFAEALLVGAEVETAKVDQPSAAIAPEYMDGATESPLPAITQESNQSEEGNDSQSMVLTRKEQAMSSFDFEETLRGTWVYSHIDRRALLREFSIRDNATFTSKVNSCRPSVTTSSRSMLSVPMTWASNDRRSIASWGSAERNAMANLELIEQYAASLESLQIELLDVNRPPQMTQSYTNVSAGGNARMMLGNSHHNTTNHYVINYSKTSTKTRLECLTRLLIMVCRPHHRERGDGCPILNRSTRSLCHPTKALSLRALSLLTSESSPRIPLETGLLYQCTQTKETSKFPEA